MVKSSVFKLLVYIMDIIGCKIKSYEATEVFYIKKKLTILNDPSVIASLVSNEYAPDLSENGFDIELSERLFF